MIDYDNTLLYKQDGAHITLITITHEKTLADPIGKHPTTSALNLRLLLATQAPLLDKLADLAFH